MKTITITGNDEHVDNIVKENRIRVSRGYVTITEGESKPISKKVVEPETKKAPVADTKDVNS